MSQRLYHLTACAHDSNDIAYADSLTWEEAAQELALGPNDDQVGPDCVLAINRRVTATVNFKDADSLEDSGLAVGADGTLVAKGKDPGGVALNDVIVNIANAVCLGKTGNLGAYREGVFGLRFSAYFADGMTNPVSYS